MASFQSCLDEGKTAGKVGEDVKEAGRLQVTSTPAFFIGDVQADGQRADHPQGNRRAALVSVSGGARDKPLTTRPQAK